MNQKQIDDAVADAEIMISTCEKMTGLVEGHHTYDTAWLLRICRALVSSRTTRPEGLANKGPTPRTDGVLPSQSFIDETRLFDRHYYLPLIDLARQLERELTDARMDFEGRKASEEGAVREANRLLEELNALRSPRLGCEHVWHAGDQGCRKCGAPQP